MLERIRATVPAAALAGASILLLTPAASAAGQPPDYTVVEAIRNAVVQVSNATGDVSASAYAPFLDRVAVSPDGKTAYVTSKSSNDVVPVDLATNTPGTPIGVPGAYAVAISPDGALAYVSGDAGITPIRLSDHVALAPIPAKAAPALSIAFAPDGHTAYAYGNDASDVGVVTPIDVASGTAQPSISVGVYARNYIRVSPDGRTAYLVVGPAGQVLTLHLTTRTLGAPIDIGGRAAQSVVPSPDGKILYVATDGGAGEQSEVLAVNLSSGAIKAVSLPVGIWPFDIAVTPDGRTLYVSHNHADQYPNPNAQLIPVDAATLTAGPGIETDSSQRGAGGGSLAITPDQAPRASFTATVGCAGTATAFDASASTVRYGTIARYAWAFGDGTTQVTTGPTVQHAYAKPGSYAASVTETDSAGTSTTVVFDGQTVLRNGGPSARARHTLTVAGCPVAAEATNPSSGSMAASTADATLPRTGGDATGALLAAGLLIGAGAVLSRAGRRAQG